MRPPSDERSNVRERANARERSKLIGDAFKEAHGGTPIDAFLTTMVSPLLVLKGPAKEFFGRPNNFFWTFTTFFWTSNLFLGRPEKFLDVPKKNEKEIGRPKITHLNTPE